MELHEQLQDVHDEHTFLEFAAALAKDRMSTVAIEKLSPSDHFGPDAGGWENTTIQDFLAAATAWAKSTSFGATQGLASDNAWRKFATFLYFRHIPLLRQNL